MALRAVPFLCFAIPAFQSKNILPRTRKQFCHRKTEAACLFKCSLRGFVRFLCFLRLLYRLKIAYNDKGLFFSELCFTTIRPAQNRNLKRRRKSMKKSRLSALILCAGLLITGCSSNSDSSKASSAASSSAASSAVSSAANSGDASAKDEGVMTYQEYIDAENDSEVTIEAFVQDKQSWWEDKATIYAADPDGAYFIYNANVPQDLYEKLTPGTKIKVSGYKTEWSGEVEVAEGADVEVIDGTTYIAPVVDVTDMLGNEEELIKHQNQKVSFNDMVIEPAEDGSDAAYLYNYDGSGEEGDDLYFKASKDGNTYTFTVESYLTDKDSDVYKAVKNLKVGDKVNMEGYLYWYEGANPHITSVTVVE